MASSIPSLIFFENELLDTAVRKVGHLGAFFVISVGASHALSGVLEPRLATRLVVFLATGVASLDEVIQLGTAGRLGSPLDVLLDVAGAVGGVLAYRRWGLGPTRESGVSSADHSSEEV